MIVIDTNILAYGALAQSEPGLRQQAQAVLNGKDRILVPSLWRHEFLNILSGYARRGFLSVSAAETYWYQAVATIQDVEAEVDMSRALELSVELGVTAYDAQFLALAEGAKAILVTEDRRLRIAAGPRAMSMQEYLAT